MAGPSVEAAKTEMYRGLIAEAAEHVFAEQGYPDAKVAEIALRAGVSLGTLYKVFEGKAEILAAVHERRAEEIYAAATAAFDRFDSPLRLVLHGVGAYVRHQVANPTYLRMLLREGVAWSEPTGMQLPEQRETWQRGFDLAVSVFADGIAKGEFLPAPPSRLARLMIVIAQATLADWVDRGMDDDDEQVVRDVLDTLVRALATPEARQALRQEGA